MRYDIYLYKYKIKLSDDELKKRLEPIGKYARVTIQDASNLGSSAVYRIVNDIVTAEQKRICQNRYDAVRMSVLKISEAEYFGIVSYCPEVSSKSLEIVLNSAFGNVSIKSAGERKNQKADLKEAKEYWRARLGQEGFSHDTVNSTRKGKMLKEVFQIGSEFELMLKDTSVLVNFRRKSMFTTAWGIIISHVFKKKTVFLEEMRYSGSLTHYPIRIDQTGGFKATYDSVEEQFMQAALYDDVSIKEIEEMLHLSFNGNLYLCQNFMLNSEYSEFPNEDKEDVVWFIPHPEDPYAPIEVTYHLDSKVPYIEYAYDSVVFKNISIKFLHESFCTLVKGFLTASGSIDMKRLQTQKDELDNKTRQLVLTGTYIKNSGFFANMSRDELMTLADRCELRTYVSEQFIMEKNTKADGLYIVGEGNVSMEMQDENYMLHPLMLLKPGDSFGFESVTDVAESQTTYLAKNHYAMVVYMPLDVLEECGAKDPRIWKAFIKEQGKRLNKFQRLWSMS